jgi:hemerythrin-like domain-containing protein
MLPMTRRAARGKASREEPVAAAATFMQMLREDHGRLSRVLREIDALASQLQATPGAARPVLAEALHYLLAYQHSIHHRREDELFARVRAREPRLYRNLRRLVQEHRVGQDQAQWLARALSRATLLELRGNTGRRLAKQLRDYVHGARDHMRREEVVFYAGSERVLQTSDWTALLAGSSARDPAADARRFADRYPRLAKRVSLAQREVTITRETSFQTGLRTRGEQLVERAATLLHRTIDVAHAAARAALRSPTGRDRSRDAVGGIRKPRSPRSR